MSLTTKEHELLQDIHARAPGRNAAHLFHHNKIVIRGLIQVYQDRRHSVILNAFVVPPPSYDYPVWTRVSYVSSDPIVPQHGGEMGGPTPQKLDVTERGSTWDEYGEAESRMLLHWDQHYPEWLQHQQLIVVRAFSDRPRAGLFPVSPFNLQVHAHLARLQCCLEDLLHRQNRYGEKDNLIIMHRRLTGLITENERKMSQAMAPLQNY